MRSCDLNIKSPLIPLFQRGNYEYCLFQRGNYEYCLFQMGNRSVHSPFQEGNYKHYLFQRENREIYNLFQREDKRKSVISQDGNKRKSIIFQDGMFLKISITFFVIVFTLISLTMPIIASTKVKSERTIKGDELKQIIGNSEQLSGLIELSLKNYEVASSMDGSAMESFVNGYRERLTEDGWKMILMGMNKGRVIMIYTQQNSNDQNKLMIAVVSSNDVSEVTLTGKINISDLDDLRNALLTSLSKYAELKPLEELLEPESSPSQSEIEMDIIDWIKRVVTEEGDKAPPSMLLELADHYKENNDYDSALKHYVMIVNAEGVPGSILVQALFNAGWISERNLNLTDAKKYYQMLIEKFGNADIHEEDYITSAELALRRLDKVKDEPRTIMGIMETADNFFLRKKNYSSAIENYESLIKNMPNSVYVESAMIMTGISYGRMVKSNPALTELLGEQIKTLKTAVNKFPSSISHLYLAMAYQDMGTYKEALDQYKTVIGDYPDASVWQMVKALYNAGECAKKLGQNEESRRYFGQLVEKYSYLNSYLIGDVEIELIKEKRGGKMPFLGLGFRYTGSVKGALIVTVFKNGPSWSAGVKKGDIIQSIDSTETPNPDAVVRFIAKKDIGDKVILHIKRGEDMIDIPVTLMETPDKLER